jgi:hypothetical protein
MGEPRKPTSTDRPDPEGQLRREQALDEALEATFPASDTPAMLAPGRRRPVGQGSRP